MFHSRRAHQGRHYRPYLEILETRDLLSTYVATGTPAQRPGSSPPRRRASARRLTAESNAGQGLRDGIRHFCPRLRRGCWLLRNSFDFVDALKAFRGIRSIEVCNGPSAKLPKIPGTVGVMDDVRWFRRHKPTGQDFAPGGCTRFLRPIRLDRGLQGHETDLLISLEDK
jgi:hypothetical protein